MALCKHLQVLTSTTKLKKTSYQRNKLQNIVKSKISKKFQQIEVDAENAFKAF